MGFVSTVEVGIRKETSFRRIREWNLLESVSFPLSLALLFLPSRFHCSIMESEEEMSSCSVLCCPGRCEASRSIPGMQQGGQQPLGCGSLEHSLAVSSFCHPCWLGEQSVKVACDNAVTPLEGSPSAQPVVQMSSLSELHPKPFRARSLQSSPSLISHVISLLCALTVQLIWSSGEG